MKSFIIILILLFSIPMIGQQTITLQECYELATVNYPLAKQSHLLEEQNQLDKEVVSNTKLPQISIDAQATYQSDVIEIPIPNSTIEPLNKDQYRATLSVNQLIYNGGATDASLDVKSAQLKTKQKQVEVNLYQLKQKINQLYFSILLSQETNLLLTAKQEQLQAKLSEVKSGVKYGVILPSSDKVLEAELLKINRVCNEAINKNWRRNKRLKYTVLDRESFNEVREQIIEDLYIPLPDGYEPDEEWLNAPSPEYKVGNVLQRPQDVYAEMKKHLGKFYKFMF